jgi:uncharacterized membrane protein YecN with MAPEG domain
MVLPITTLYAIPLALIGLVLQAQVGRTRVRQHISLNDGGNRELIEAIRRHMNWVENVPFIVLLLGIIEFNGTSHLWLHVLYGVLLVARIIHPFGISMDNMGMPQRIVGAGATMIVTLAAIGTLAWQILTG